MNYIKNSIKNFKMMIFIYIPVMFFVFLTAFMILLFPEKAAEGVKNGLNLSFDVLIPSMYVFIVLSIFVVESDIASKMPGIIGRVFEFMLDLPAEALWVMVLSMSGGYPVGPKCTVNLLEKGTISRNHAKKLLLFSVNPSPAFVIGTVGVYMLNNKKLGLIMYISIITASLIIGYISRFISLDEDEYIAFSDSAKHTNMAEAFVKSVKSGAKSMIGICSFVVLFSCINSLLELLNLSGGVKLFAYCALEVTNGCVSACSDLPASAIAAIISFGGLCTLCQILPDIIKIRLDLKIFLAARIISAGLSAVICEGLMAVIPISCETFSTATKPHEFSNSSSFWVSAGLIILTVLFILGDDYIIKRKSNKAEKYSKTS